jgi:hypothetical protein
MSKIQQSEQCVKYYVAATVSASSARDNFTTEKCWATIIIPSIVSFCVFLFIIYCTDIYLFVLCSDLINLLPLSVCPCPLLHICVLLSPCSAHGIFTII